MIRKSTTRREQMRGRNSEVMGFSEIAEKFPREGYGPPLNSRQHADMLVTKALKSFKRNLFALTYAERMTARGFPTTLEEGVRYYYQLILEGVDVDSMIKVQL
jgi:hypothetical protein